MYFETQELDEKEKKKKQKKLKINQASKILKRNHMNEPTNKQMKELSSTQPNILKQSNIRSLKE